MPTEHTIGHVNCPACEANLREAIEGESFAALSVTQAALRWIEHKQLSIQVRTLRDYKQHIKSLGAFFDPMPLSDFHIGNVRSYQKHRMASGVGGIRINHEVSTLGQLLKEAGVWHKIKPYHKALPMPKEGPGVALTREELSCLVRLARKRPRWTVALYASLLSVETTAGPGEIRNLRLKDCDLPRREISIVKGTKNRYRIRTLPLTETGTYALERLMERAADRGCSEADHYLIPHRADTRGERKFDPTRPASHWNTAWRSMRKAAAKEHPKLATLRMYDLRHTAISWLLEDPSVPERVVIELAGHVNNQMLNRYSHQRKDAKRKAVQSLDSMRPVENEVMRPFVISRNPHK